MSVFDNPCILVAGCTEIAKDLYEHLNKKQFEVDFVDQPLELDKKYNLIFIFLDDNLEEKCIWIKSLNQSRATDSLLCVNIDGVSLEDIQAGVGVEVIGVNFCYPITASPFMEIISTVNNNATWINQLSEWAKKKLNKDPYTVYGGISARAYMLAAMARESFYLVDQGYASIESIDRACRNDAGYYLPFTGNYLYMDLMGTVAYAMVMKDLNRELANDSEVPSWFETKINSGETGMKSLLGLYQYNKGDFEKWDSIVKEYAIEINEIITKYKKAYVEG